MAAEIEAEIEANGSADRLTSRPDYVSQDEIEAWARHDPWIATQFREALQSYRERVALLRWAASPWAEKKIETLARFDAGETITLRQYQGGRPKWGYVVDWLMADPMFAALMADIENQSLSIVASQLLPQLRRATHGQEKRDQL